MSFLRYKTSSGVWPVTYSGALLLRNLPPDYRFKAEDPKCPMELHIAKPTGAQFRGLLLICALRENLGSHLEAAALYNCSVTVLADGTAVTKYDGTTILFDAKDGWKTRTGLVAQEFEDIINMIALNSDPSLDEVPLVDTSMKN